jgi:hypothetical protein
MTKKSKPKIEVQLERETFKFKISQGGKILSFDVWGYVQDGKTVVTRYNLAYINPLICQKDKGEFWDLIMLMIITTGTMWGK